MYECARAKPLTRSFHTDKWFRTRDVGASIKLDGSLLIKLSVNLLHRDLDYFLVGCSCSLFCFRSCCNAPLSVGLVLFAGCSYSKKFRNAAFGWWWRGVALLSALLLLFSSKSKISLSTVEYPVCRTGGIICTRLHARTIA